MQTVTQRRKQKESRMMGIILGSAFGLIGLAVVIMVSIGACNPINAAAMRYHLTGTVMDVPHSKNLGGDNRSLATKFSIRLQLADREDIVNCDSTQCASLAPGDTVKLSCYREWHWTQPIETECRFVELAAP